MSPDYFVTRRGGAKPVRHRHKRQAIRIANRFARLALGNPKKKDKRARQVSVRVGKPTGKLLYQCHAAVVGGHVRIVREEL